LKLVSLRVKDFRRFYGDQEINFSTDNKKTFTIIHAENGTGKSNLLNAINWCLYGELVKGTSQPDNLINQTHLLQEGKRSYTEVRLKVVNDDNKELMFLRRKNISEKDSLAKAYEGPDEIPIDDKNIVKNIEALIPKELSKYFFFHGEGLKNLTSEASNIKRAVQDIQGVTDTQAILYEIVKNKTTLQNKIKKSLSAGSNLERISSDLESYNKIIEQKREQLKSEESNRDTLNLEIDLLDKDLRNSDVDLIKAKQKEREGLEKNLVKLKNDLNNHGIKKFESSRKFYKDIINLDVAKKCADVFKKLEADELFPADLSDNLLNIIVEKEKCICGTSVKLGSEEHKNIEKWREVSASAGFTAHVLSLNKYDSYLQTAKQFNLYMSNHEEIKSVLEDDIEEKTGQLSDLNNFLSEGLDNNLNELNNKRQQKRKDRDDANNKIKSLNISITDFEKKKAPFQQQYNQELQKSKMDPVLQKQYDFLNKADDRLRKMLNSYESQAQSFVKERIGEYFDKYATKEFQVDFDENFLPTLKEMNVGGRYTPAPESTGESLLKNIAFICSLVEFANKRKGEKPTSFQIKGVRSPLVIDAPFGDADGRYSSALANILTNCDADQVIIFLSKKHYKGAFEKITKELKNVGSRYIIDNFATGDDEKELQDIEDNREIEIGNKSYTQIHVSKEEFGYSSLRAIK
jgi:DNA sulfur modification protein DndD